MLCGASCILIAGIWAFLKVDDGKKQIMAIAYLVTGFLAGKKLQYPIFDEWISPTLSMGESSFVNSGVRSDF